MKLLNSAVVNTFRNANASPSGNVLEIKCLVPAVSWDDQQEVTCLSRPQAGLARPRYFLQCGKLGGNFTSSAAA